MSELSRIVLTRRQAGVQLAGWALGGGLGANAWAQAKKPATGESADLRTLIAKGTRLSVLSDRITRSQVQRALGVLVSRAERVLADSTAEAKSLLAALGTSGAPSSTRAQYQAVSKAYGEFLQVSDRLNPQQRDGLAKFAHQADEVGEAVDKLVELYVKEMGQPVAKILSLTADLQRLTQHLAVHFLLARAGIEEAEQQKEVNQGRQEFIKHYADLKKAAPQGGNVALQFQLIDNQWLLMNQALNQTSRDMYAMEHTASTSERTLEVLTALYPQFEAGLR